MRSKTWAKTGRDEDYRTIARRPRRFAVLVFLLSVVALSALNVLRYQAMSDIIGAPISPRNPLDMGGALVFAWLFFSSLKREEKSKQPRVA